MIYMKDVGPIKACRRHLASIVESQHQEIMSVGGKNSILIVAVHGSELTQCFEIHSPLQSLAFLPPFFVCRQFPPIPNMNGGKDKFPKLTSNGSTTTL